MGAKMNNPSPQEYRGVKLRDIPSGMGGVLPVAVSNEVDGTTWVVCLHDEFFPNWVLTVPSAELRPFSHRLDAHMKKIIDSRLPDDAETMSQTQGSAQQAYNARNKTRAPAVPHVKPSGITP
jgi:hypothetical protein